MNGTKLGGLRAAATHLGITPEEYEDHVALGEKWCTSCREWHSRGVFLVDRSRGDGLAASCRKRSRPFVTAEERRERRLERVREGYRRYYAGAGGAAIRARVYGRKRATEPIEPLTRELVIEGFNGRCAYCGRTAETLDHLAPVKHGGASRRGNLVAACRSCNSRKGTRDLDDFLDDCVRRGLSPNGSRIAEELCMEYVLG